MAAGRSAHETVFTTPSDREVAATRTVDAPRSIVWECWTDPKHVSSWLLGPTGWTMPVCEIDLRPGGTWHYVWRRTDGSEMGMRGTYKEVVPPEKLVYTESWGGDWPETINTLLLTEQNGRTQMVQTVHYPSKEERDRAIGTGMKDGWAVSLDRLEEYLPTIV